MTKSEMSAALSIAQSDADLMNEDISVFNGYGLHDFATVYVTLRQVACIIRWQAAFLNGNWDAHEITQIADLGRSRFQII